MSRPVKSLIVKELTERFKDVDSVAVINPRGISATKDNQIRQKLREHGVRITVIKNSLARRAFAQGKLGALEPLLDGPTALVYGEPSISAIARLLLEQKKIHESLELRGVLFDGQVYPGAAGVEQVSKLPTREEALGAVLAAVLGPGRRLAGLLASQPGRIAMILKSIEANAGGKESAAA